MAGNIYTLFSRISPKLRGIFYKQWYQFLSRFHQRKDWIFMNYGFAPLDDQIKDQKKKIDLEKADEDNRFFIQLYHHVAGAVDLSDLEVLEIGSGRGGGADYIKRYLKPEKWLAWIYQKVLYCFVIRFMLIRDFHSKLGMLSLYHSRITVLMSC